MSQEVTKKWVSVGYSPNIPHLQGSVKAPIDPITIDPFTSFPGHPSTPLKFNSSPLKNDGTGRQLSYWVSAYFRGVNPFTDHWSPHSELNCPQTWTRNPAQNIASGPTAWCALSPAVWHVCMACFRGCWWVYGGVTSCPLLISYYTPSDIWSMDTQKWGAL